MDAYIIEGPDHQAKIVADMMRAWANMPMNAELTLEVATCMDTGEVALVVTIAAAAYLVSASAIRAMVDIRRPPETDPLVERLVDEIEKAEAEVAQLTRH